MFLVEGLGGNLILTDRMTRSRQALQAGSSLASYQFFSVWGTPISVTLQTRVEDHDGHEPHGQWTNPMGSDPLSYNF